MADGDEGGEGGGGGEVIEGGGEGAGGWEGGRRLPRPVESSLPRQVGEGLP